MAFTWITVTRRYLTAELGIPATGRVIFTPQVPMVNGDTVIAAPRASTLDAEGDLTLQVAANNDPTTSPVGASYLVREEITGQRAREYYVVVPYNAPGGTVDLSTLVTAQIPPVVTYPVAGPPGPQGPTGAPGPNTIGTATDLDVTAPAVGQVIAVATTSPLAFDLDTLDAADVGADPAGAASTAVSMHVAAADPHPQYLTAAEGNAAYQPLDTDLTAIAGLDSATAGAIASDGAGWIKKTYAQLKTALGLTSADIGLGNVVNAAQVQLGLIDAKGDLLVGTAADTIARVAVGASDGLVLAVSASQAAGVRWHANPTTPPVTLTDGATVALDASAGKVFRLSASGDRTIDIPTNPSNGRGIIVAHVAAGGANRTLTLATGSSGAFKFGTDITGLTVTTAGLTDYIGCIYDSTIARWLVISYVKGY